MYPVADNHYLTCVTEFQIAKHADKVITGNVAINPRTAHLVVNALLRNELDFFWPAIRDASLATLTALHPELTTLPEFERAHFHGYSHRIRKHTFPGMECYDNITALQPLIVWTALIELPHDPPRKGLSCLINDPTKG